LVFKDRWTSWRLVVVLAALVAALAVSACGDSDDDGGDAKGSSADSAQAPGGGNANASNDDAGSGDGGATGSGNASSGDTEPINLKQVKLTPADRRRLQSMAPKPRPYTGYGFDRGSKKDKAALMGSFRKMQRAFWNGDAMGVCREFGTDLYSLPQLKSGDGKQRVRECAAIVSRTAKQVATGKERWKLGAVQWVRVYRDTGEEPFGGVTVRSSGREIRLGFALRDGRWRPDFRVPADLHTFSAV
jgi:hypothetical protein